MLLGILGIGLALNSRCSRHDCTLSCALNLTGHFQRQPRHVELTFIRNLAVTPANVRDMSQEEVSRICLDYTLVGLKAMAEVANTSRPFRVVYTSGVLSERDQDRVLWFQGRYRKMRVSLGPDLIWETTMLQSAANMHLLIPLYNRESRERYLLSTNTSNSG